MAQRWQRASDATGKNSSGALTGNDVSFKMSLKKFKEQALTGLGQSAPVLHERD
ncbi:MAG TPA: hypothetical protein VKT82_29510 [Ktedonobacterales bacterium]|nr:hypothetical protein [Ktedonobacterales bacterium]